MLLRRSQLQITTSYMKKYGVPLPTRVILVIPVVTSMLSLAFLAIG